MLGSRDVPSAALAMGQGRNIAQSAGGGVRAGCWLFDRPVWPSESRSGSRSSKQDWGLVGTSNQLTHPCIRTRLRPCVACRVIC